MRSRTYSARRAFTLLEVLLVVAILAILAVAVVPNLIGAGDRAKIDHTRATVALAGPVGTALDLYRTHMNKYPEELKALTEKPSDEEEAKRWFGPYINDPNSLKDAWGRDLMYKCPGEHHEDKYDLWSVGPDGQDGTDDDICNWEKG